MEKVGSKDSNFVKIVKLKSQVAMIHSNNQGQNRSLRQKLEDENLTTFLKRKNRDPKKAHYPPKSKEL